MKKIIYSFIALAILSALVLDPHNCISAAQSGLALSINVLAPSLFPFFVVSRLLILLGLVDALGQHCQRFMRPVFNVPGCGAFAFLIGILSGYPVGAKTVTELYDQGSCTRVEAQRLLAFCNNSGPLFIIGTVGTVLYNSPKIGGVLYAAHILSALTIGFLFRFYKPRKAQLEKVTQHNRNKKKAPHKVDTLSSILTESIAQSVKLTALISGFVIFFSVLLSILNFYKILPLISSVLAIIGLPSAYATGFFEITSGLAQLAQTGMHLPLAGALLAWSGVSAILQVTGIIGEKFSKKVFIIGKAIQAAFAALYTFLLLRLAPSIPATAQVNDLIESPPLKAANAFGHSCLLLALALALFIIISHILSPKNQ